MTPKKTKEHSRIQVPPQEIEELFNLLSNKGLDRKTALAAIGYRNPSSVIHTVSRTGGYAAVVKFALKGLIADKFPAHTSKAGLELDYDTAEALFDALRIARKAAPGRETVFKRLQSQTAQILVNLTRQT